MRIAALAFGVVAGLVASLILALGGLDVAIAAADERQLALLRFALYVVANLGIFAAGIALAAPLAGAIMALAGALAWVAAAVLLRHGPDYVTLVPPSLLLVAAAFAGVAFIRGRSEQDDDYVEEEDFAPRRPSAPAVAQRAPARQHPAHEPEMEIEEDENENEEEEEEEDGRQGIGAVPVNASFFGDSGTAMPLRGAMPRPAQRAMRAFDRDDEDWQPVRRRTEPPRQGSVFRPPEEEYDDEGGMERFSRVASSILTFGLYAALIAAAVLIFVNLRTSDGTHTPAGKVEASATLPSSAEVEPPVLAASLPSSTPPLSSSSSVAPVIEATASLPPVGPLSALGSVGQSHGDAPRPAQTAAIAPALTAASTPADLTPPSTPADPGSPHLLDGVIIAPDPTTEAALPSSAAAPSTPDAPDGTVADVPPAAAGVLMPFPMTSEMAAARARGAETRPSPPRQATPATPRNDTGL